MWRVPNNKANAEQSMSSETTTIRISSSTSSTDLVDKTTGTRPTLFHSSRTRSGRILPERKSYGVLDIKPNWETRRGSLFGGRATRVFAGDPDLEQAIAKSGIPAALKETAFSPPPKFAGRRRSRRSSSFGKESGNASKPDGANLVVTAGEGHAVKSRQSSLSWSRRAAAAAYGIGRRLKERRTSWSKNGTKSSNGSVAGQDSIGVAAPNRDE
ncbi:hypothetical protein B0T26DRAFT_682900 [Lasiosphaeria miniovina]|uniref:Uncharacterized protein n=1 Tax=Lasiosphaeria miniovina TaxID=1954250 RepID=A0AA40EF89_9PEZI|nr:uncharacterized protein B0T26DRAFT_682900 [Lasiosphaeria miniovina]KAK0733113.1 hypothetical protein B0T26DRAFT_682900 [Lasiosphaeria miniovina]